jgi:hypothetical protein
VRTQKHDAERDAARAETETRVLVQVKDQERAKNLEKEKDEGTVEAWVLEGECMDGLWLSREGHRLLLGIGG